MKRYDYLVLFFFFLFVLVLYYPRVDAELPLNGKTIYIDPGHGGVDPGSVVQNILEKDINLEISKYLGEELKKYGAHVFFTREGDYDLGSPNASYRKKSDFDGRIKRINQSHADLYLSIHLNVLEDSRYSGPQVFYNSSNQESERLSQHIQKVLNEMLEGDREVKKIPSKTYMYSKLSVTGVLIECGFLSNAKERKLLTTSEYQKKIADAIAVAIRDYSF